MTAHELIVICVPTCLRPQMLGECLRSLTKTRIPSGCEAQLIVLDNDADKSARDVVAAMQFPFAARYICEPQRGLSSVRNRALTEVISANAAYLAFCDDDQTVDDNWLCALADGLHKTGADAIGGYVVDIYPDNKVPWWVRPSKIQLDENAKISRRVFRFPDHDLLLMKAPQGFARLMRFDRMQSDQTGALAVLMMPFGKKRAAVASLPSVLRCDNT